MDGERSREQDWLSEANVQERVIEYMRDEEGFTILSPGHPVCKYQVELPHIEIAPALDRCCYKL